MAATSMTDTDFTSQARAGRMTFAGVAALIAGGVAATLVWELFARGVAPLWIGGPLQPAGLVQSVFAKAGLWPLVEAFAAPFGLGVDRGAVAEGVHLATGLIGYPLAFVLIARPIARAAGRVLPSALVSWPVLGAAYGAALFVFAMYVLAHLVAGFPPFFNFGPLGQASLVGHVLYGLALAGVVRAARGR